jgi:hypothetical protein
MKIKSLTEIGFRDDSETAWELYRKKYETFELCVNRYRRGNINKFDIICLCNENPSEEVTIKEGVDIDWVVEFDRFLNNGKCIEIEPLISKLEELTERYIQAEQFIINLKWYERLFCSRKINKFLKNHLNKFKN